MPRSRSKSPAPSRRSNSKPKASMPSVDVSDPNVQLFITAGALALTTFATQKGVMPENFSSLFMNDHKVNIAGKSYSLLLTGHMVNSARKANRGYWLSSLVNCIVGCFASVIVPQLISGNGFSLFKDAETMCLMTMFWYLCNHDIPFVGINIWSMIAKFGGSTLDNLLEMCSLIFNTNQIIGNARGNVYKAVVMGTAAGTASNFFPLSKGMPISRNAAHDRAFLTSLFLGLGGFAFLSRSFMGIQIPIVGEFLQGQVNSIFGGNAQFVMHFTILHNLFGHFLPVSPFMVYERVCGFLGLSI